MLLMVCVLQVHGQTIIVADSSVADPSLPEMRNTPTVLLLTNPIEIYLGAPNLTAIIRMTDHLAAGGGIKLGVATDPFFHGEIRYYGKGGAPHGFYLASLLTWGKDLNDEYWSIGLRMANQSRQMYNFTLGLGLGIDYFMVQSSNPYYSNFFFGDEKQFMIPAFRFNVGLAL